MSAHILKTWIHGVIKFGMVATAAVALSGCAWLSQTAHPAYRPVVVEGVDINVVYDVLVKGFDEIQEHALDKPPLDTMFMAALNGMKTVDPALQVKSVKKSLALYYSDRKIVELGPASKPDIRTWSFATLRALMGARRSSPAFRALDEEGLYKVVFGYALTTLDPYSRYAGRQVAASLRLVREGVIGLGVRLELDSDGARVKAILDDSPASNAGLHLNDMIVQANGVRLKNRQLAEVRRSLDGSVGKTVNLTVRRPGEQNPLDFKVALDLVVPDTVAETFDNGILVLTIQSFNQRTAYAVEKAVTTARDSGKLKAIVLDFRGNGGGLLDQAVDIADLFLDSGDIITLRGRHPDANQYYKANPGDIAPGIPMALLIDGKSASAAEIVVAALQDNHRATVIGTVSWGKGSVQTIRRLPNSGEFALTWARAMTPRGAALHGLGLLPNVCLSNEEDSATSVASRLRAGTGTNVAAQHQWQAPEDNPAAHEALRKACPPEAHSNRALDLDVAKRIITDPTLMALAIPDDAPQLAVKP